MRILFIGDVVGSPGRTAIKELLPKIRRREGVELVIANGENVAGGSGMTPPLADELLGYGIDVITNGDHVWKRKEIIEKLEADTRVLRPANYPAESPGFGSTVVKSSSGAKVGVINLVGRVFMEAVECPFRAAKSLIEKMKDTKVIVVDIHAEATSEKIALGWFLDGMVSAIVGTHTHVQTADEKILPNGTAYITDVGMTGPYDSVIGRRKEQILTRFLTQMPARFEMAEGDIQLHGVVIDIDETTGKARSITRIQEKLT
jgi:hypothetical protein